MTNRRGSLASRTYRHVNRYRQILTVLIKYGFGGVVQGLRIADYLDIGLNLLSPQHHERVTHLTAAQRVRMALEELGPTFVKLGQILSTRPDLLPPEFIAEFSKLQQDVAPFPFEEVQAILAKELGRPVDAVFAEVEPTPLASASIGQVHRATLRDGSAAVVKVQRPGIAPKIEVDIEILSDLAGLAATHVPGLRVLRPARLVEEFGIAMARELDYTREAAHVERFARQFRGDATVRLPRVYRDATTPRVLTLEYLPVIRLTDADALAAAGIDRRELAARGARVCLRQLFEFGFFHADPHPGNIFALPGNVACLLDFGQVGRLDRRAREDVAALIHAVALRDPTRVTRVLLRVTEHDDDASPDVRLLERDVADFLDLNVPEALGDLRFGRLMQELLALVRRHELFIPADLFMTLKAAATIERVVALLDPELNLAETARPYVRRVRMAQMRPRRLWREMLDASEEMLGLAREVPGGVRELLRLARRGALRMGVEHRGLEKVMEAHERTVNRLAFAVVVGSLVVASSLIVHARLPPMWNGIPVIGLVGYVIAGALGFMLLFAILRHGRL